MQIHKLLSGVAVCLISGCGAAADGGRSVEPQPWDGGLVATDAATTSPVAMQVDGSGPMQQPAKTYPLGDPGCGLEAAAFCATFDEVAGAGPEGRVAELDARLWSGARMQPGLNWGPAATPVRAATIPSCRDDLPAQVFPGQDALVCNGNELLQSRHLLTAAAEQSYGQLSLRVRRPFDFQGRTGTIVFDVEGDINALLQGWASVAITEDPSPAPSFGVWQNFENGAIPRAGLEIHLFDVCSAEDRIGVGQVNVFRDYVETYYVSGEGGRSASCVQTERGALNHFEIRVSRSHLEVWGSDRSLNGRDFPVSRKIFDLNVDLPFERGYVHLNTHNHSSLKYSDNKVDAFTARWDNVGFDGPQISDRREYSVGDSLERVDVDAVPRVNVGYQLHDVAEGPAQKLVVHDVDPDGASAAHLALNGHFNMSGGAKVEDYVLKYRVNGHDWLEYRFNDAQLAMLHGPLVYNEAGQSKREPGSGIAGAMSLLLPVDRKVLVRGENSFEFVTSGVPTSYRPYVSNIDLVLDL